MYKFFPVFACAALVAGPAAASDKTDVMAVVKQFEVAFNKGDAKAGIATCADQTSILDDFSPYVWNGAGACAKWYGDLTASDKTLEISDEIVIMGKARHVDVAADYAYIVMPVSLTYTMKGKAMKQSGSVWTVVLHKEAVGWRITGWSWSDGTDAEVPAAAGH